jgi:glutamate decarboxylase
LTQCQIKSRPTTEQLPLVAFHLDGERDYDEFDIAAQLAAERG